MDSKDKNKSFSLRYKNIRVLKYSQFDLIKDFDEKCKTLINYQSNFNFKITSKENIISCFINIEMIVVETEELFSELKIENIFDIENLSEVIIVDNEKMRVPDALIQTIASLSISTARGVLSEKLKGTFAQNEVYPIVDLASLFKKANA
jgi:hypothetical protein